MRVLLVGDFGAVHSRRYCELIALAGCEVVLLDRRARRTFERRHERHHHWPAAAGALTRWLGGSVQRAIAKAAVAVQLRALLARIEPDIVHVQWFDELPLVFADIAPRLPRVVTAWGTDVNGLPKLRDRRARARLVAAVAATDLVIADAQAIIDTLAAETGVPFASALLPIGIDTALFAPGRADEAARWRRELGIPDRARVLLSARAFRANYRHELALQAVKALAEDGLTDLCLVLKQYDDRPDGYRAYIDGLVAELGLGSCVRIVSECAYDRLPGLYAMADLVLNMPVADGFPVTFLESCACAVPVVTTWQPAYEGSEISRYLISAEPSAGALAAAIAQTLRDSDRMALRARQARAAVVRHYDQRVIATRLRGLYEGLSRRRVSASPPAAADAQQVSAE